MLVAGWRFDISPCGCADSEDGLGQDKARVGKEGSERDDKRSEKGKSKSVNKRAQKQKS